MNHEALASKAADAVGVTPHSDMRLFVEQAVKWALKEAALSTAEPVATVAEMGAGGMRVLMPHPPGSTDHLPIGTKLYAAPPALSAQVQDVAGWQPIETAPRDGTAVIMYHTRLDNRCDVHKAWWDGECWRGYGWSYPEFSQPTHWMPLPAAPAKQEG